METQDTPLQNINCLQDRLMNNQPSIGFSPDRTRFESPRTEGQLGSMDINSLILMGNKEPAGPPFSSDPQPPHQNGLDGGKVPGSGSSGTQLQKRLERHIAHANASSSSSNGNPAHGHGGENSWSSKQSGINPSSESRNNGKLKGPIPTSPNHSTTSGLDSRTRALLPPQRLAIPRKPNTTTSSSPHLHSQEAKPLVQWDTDDSEEELSFFPQAKAKARLTDNLSIDNLSLSGEEEDLHLAPPRLLPSGRCPCDPRPFLRPQWDRVRRMKQCLIA